MRRVVLLVIAAVLVPLPALDARAGTSCVPWTMRTVADGLGSLENLEPDGTGGMLIGASSRNAVERLMPDGSRTTVASVRAPGGLRVRGQTLYAVTGGSFVAGLTGAEGTVDAIGLRIGEHVTYSRPLEFPNGLVFEPDGDAYVSRDFGEDAHITRIPASDPMHPDTRWAALKDTNGLAIDPTNTWLYASTTFNAEAAVYRVLLDDPAVIERIAELGSLTDPFNGLDDMTIGNDGELYITANGMGRIWQLDPETGERCIIASGLQNPTAVKFGRGPGWPADHLFVSGWDGRIRELAPPG